MQTDLKQKSSKIQNFSLVSKPLIVKGKQLFCAIWNLRMDICGIF